MREFTALQLHFRDSFPKEIYKLNEPLSAHTSFRIGGGAEVMAFPKTAEDLAELLKLAKSLSCKCTVLGAGTNVLAPDEGMEGIVICLKDGLSGKEVLEGNRIRVMAGETLTKAAVFAANLGLSGMEFAHGIPGTVGGGIFMNAGAYGGELSHICESVDVMDLSGSIRTLSREEMSFSYRHSILEDSGEIVIRAVFALVPGDAVEIRSRMKELMAKRSASQPLDLPSAGSAFKRPSVGYAGAYIEQAGLKGFQIGDAAISTKHAGFAVNLGKATASDIKTLLSRVADTVFEKFGVRLEPEIRIY